MYKPPVPPKRTGPPPPAKAPKRAPIRPTGPIQEIQIQQQKKQQLVDQQVPAAQIKTTEDKVDDSGKDKDKSSEGNLRGGQTNIVGKQYNIEKGSQQKQEQVAQIQTKNTTLTQEQEIQNPQQPTENIAEGSIQPQFSNPIQTQLQASATQVYAPAVRRPPPAPPKKMGVPVNKAGAKKPNIVKPPPLMVSRQRIQQQNRSNNPQSYPQQISMPRQQNPNTQQNDQQKVTLTNPIIHPDTVEQDKSTQKNQPLAPKNVQSQLEPKIQSTSNNNKTAPVKSSIQPKQDIESLITPQKNFNQKPDALVQQQLEELNKQVSKTVPQPPQANKKASRPTPAPPNQNINKNLAGKVTPRPKPPPQTQPQETRQEPTPNTQVPQTIPKLPKVQSQLYQHQQDQPMNKIPHKSTSMEYSSLTPKYSNLKNKLKDFSIRRERLLESSESDSEINSQTYSEMDNKRNRERDGNKQVHTVQSVKPIVKELVTQNSVDFSNNKNVEGQMDMQIDIQKFPSQQIKKNNEIYASQVIQQVNAFSQDKQKVGLQQVVKVQRKIPPAPGSARIPPPRPNLKKKNSNPNIRTQQLSEEMLQAPSAAPQRSYTQSRQKQGIKQQISQNYAEQIQVESMQNNGIIREGDLKNTKDKKQEINNQNQNQNISANMNKNLYEYNGQINQIDEQNRQSFSPIHQKQQKNKTKIYEQESIQENNRQQSKPTRPLISPSSLSVQLSSASQQSSLMSQISQLLMRFSQQKQAYLNNAHQLTQLCEQNRDLEMKKINTINELLGRLAECNVQLASIVGGY